LFLASWQAIRANNAEHMTRRNAYAAEINVAFHALDENNLGRARELLDRQRPRKGEEDLRGFEWRYLWQLCRGDEFKTFDDQGARAATFSPDGKLFVYSDSKIIVREVASLKQVVTLPGSAETLSFAPHTNLLASGNNSGVKLWDTETWREVRSLANTMSPSLFSPDGRWLLTGVTGGFRVWETQTWQPVGDCPGEPRLASGAWNAVTVSPDGQFLVTVAGKDEAGARLRVWRLPSMERLPDIRIENEQPLSAAFSADGKHILVGLWNGQLAVLNFATRQVRATSKEHSARVTAIAVAANGQTFVTSSADRTVNLWDATTFKHLARLRGHVSVVWCVAISPDGRLVVSGSTEGRQLMALTKLWNTSTRHLAPVLEGSGLVAGSFDDGRRVVAATSKGWRVWTPESGARMDFPIPTNLPVVTLGKPYDVKPDEPVGALGRSDGSIEIWHLTTGALVTAWPGHPDGVSVVTFSPDGKRLASGTTNGEVKIWDFESRREVARTGPMDCHLFCLAFSPDGKTLAASGKSSRVWLWNAITGAEVRQLGGHGDPVPSVAFSPDGKLLATTTFLANEARLWELPSGKELAPLKGHVSGVTAVAFSPDGKTLATGGFDNKVKLWSVATHQELVTLSLDNLYPTLRFSPDGRTLMLGDRARGHRRIQVLRAPSFEDIAAAQSP
jgi:WD40 repeat protein